MAGGEDLASDRFDGVLVVTMNGQSARMLVTILKIVNDPQVLAFDRLWRLGMKTIGAKALFFIGGDPEI
jgi:hypothetical protein